MPIFTFSTKTTRPADTDSIKKAKELCAKKGLNFSALVVRLIGEWLVEQEQPANLSIAVATDGKTRPIGIGSYKPAEQESDDGKAKQ